MRAKGLMLGCVAIAVMLSTAAVAPAEDTAELKAQLEALQARIEKMEQEQSNTMHKEEVTAMMREILDDAAAQPAMPKWLENFKLYGDLRLRFETTSQAAGPFGWEQGPNAGVGFTPDSPKTRNRARFRLRIGGVKTWWDKQMEVGFRLASDGRRGDQVMQANSANQTFGGGFNKKTIGIDLAYAKYMPKCVEGLTVMGGKVKNPLRTKTLVTWDGDINPEGFAVDYQAPFFGDFKPYFQAGYWLLGENQAFGNGFAGGDTVRDATLWTLSLGFDWKVMDDVKTFLGVTWYKWQNYRYIPGNGVGGSNIYGFWDPYNPYPDMENVELTGKVKWKMLDLPWEFWGTWVHNCEDTYDQFADGPFNGQNFANGFERNWKNKDNAMAFGLKVGKNKKKGDWSAQAVYYWVQGNSVAWLTTDSDYGGPNVKGWKLGGKYNIDDFLTLGMSMYIFNPLDAPAYGSANQDLLGNGYNTDGTCRLQLDMMWKF